MIGVAISGKAGAGKNHFADELSIRLVALGLWPVQMGFAEGPKAELWETQGLRKEDPGGRDALVELAHSRRSMDALYWVRRLAQRCESLSPFGAISLITDMRYANELAWAKESGLVTVRLDATRADRMAVLLFRGEDPEFADSMHPSETELDEASFDARFWNNHADPFWLARFAVRVVEMAVGEVERAA